MKITTIQIQNVLGACAVNLRLDKIVTLFAGRNGSGKSSLQEAVRMALTGESVRVALKKDYAQLITAGQSAGFAEVFCNDDEQPYNIVLPSGKGNHSDHPALPYVLDAQHFAQLDPAARRTFLFGLMRLRSDGAAVRQRLTAKGCNAQHVETVLPLLRAGFEAGQKEAQARARDHKAQWKTVTGGETYGEKKAATFQIAAPQVDFSGLAQARTDLTVMEKDLEVCIQNHAVAKAQIERAQKQAAQLAGLRQQAGMFARVEHKLSLDGDELKKWQAKVEDTRLKAGIKPAQRPLPQSCPHCGGMLRLNQGNIEEHNEDTPPHYDAESAAKLTEYENSLRVLQNAVENGKRDLAAANAAAHTLAAMEEEATTAPAVDLDALRNQIDTLKHNKAGQVAAIRLFEDAQRRAAEAEQTTAQALALHQEVQAWEAIAAALAPDGIPGDMLRDALDPINERLAYAANEAQWTRINVGCDMSIYAAEEGAQPRPYALLSESEQWRADAMIAEAVSHLSGVKLLVLDRFDVLDLQGRNDLLCWLDALADQGEIETALLFGTLKALPAVLLENMAAYWIENGVTGQIREAA